MRKLFAAGFLALITVSSFAQQAANKKPNIIFILTDDLGYGDLGVFYQQLRAKTGNRAEPWMFTPQLDVLAKEGTMLPRQYCPAPVCAPSRASLMLGVHQGHANIRDNQFDKALENNHTIATTLHQLGYTTAAIGKWGLQGDKRWEADGDKWPGHPLNRGFDYFFGYMRHSDGHEHYPKEGLYRKPKEVWENRKEISNELDKCYTADLWTAKAKQFITQHTTQPFFLFLAFDTPHAVLELATQAYPEGGGLKGGMQWLGKAGAMINTANGTIDSYVHPDYANATYDHDNNPQTPEVAWPDTYKRYASSVRRIDDGVGDIVQLLKDLQLDENTMIVFTSDNGPSIESYLPAGFAPNRADFFNSFGPFDGIKRDVWEGGVRMPAIARWPGHIPANQQIKTASSAYDWMATFTDMAGAPAPARTDGVSLLPCLTGKGKQCVNPVYIEYFQEDKTPDFREFGENHRGRKRGQMQLIGMDDYVGVRYDIQSKDDDFEIYDVVKDPGQRTPLKLPFMQQLMKDMVLQMRRPDMAAPRPYDDALMPAVKASNLRAGLHWASYKGTYPWVPNVATLVSNDKGIAKKIIVTDKSEVRCFAGYINVPADGAYTFTLRTDEGALLRVHEAVIIDADFGYQGGTEKSGKVLLAKGLHPFRINYKHTSGKAAPLLDVQWEGPGIRRQSLSTATFIK